MAERRNYQARPKAKPDEEGHVRLSCPAANPWPLVCCELKRGSLTPQTTGRMRLQLKSDLKVNPPPSCSQQSVTIPPEAGAKFGQELLHGSAEWHTAYSRLRSINEGFNGYVKDPALEALDDPAPPPAAIDFTAWHNRPCSQPCSWRRRYPQNPHLPAEGCNGQCWRHPASPTPSSQHSSSRLEPTNRLRTSPIDVRSADFGLRPRHI